MRTHKSWPQGRPKRKKRNKREKEKKRKRETEKRGRTSSEDAGGLIDSRAEASVPLVQLFM